MKDLEGNSSNTTSFQKKFNNIFNDNYLHEYIQLCFESIRNMDSPIAKPLVMLYRNGRTFFLHYHSMCTQNWKENLTSLQMMLPWVSAHDSVHYCKYLPLYWSTMINLDKEKVSCMNVGYLVNTFLLCFMTNGLKGRCKRVKRLRIARLESLKMKKHSTPT